MDTKPPLPRVELPALATIRDADARFFLRFYLRSNMARDQDVARERCTAAGIDYAQARHEAALT